MPRTDHDLRDYADHIDHLHIACPTVTSGIRCCAGSICTCVISSADSAQESSARPCRSYGCHPVPGARSYRSSPVNDLDHQVVGVCDLPDT